MASRKTHMSSRNQAGKATTVKQRRQRKPLSHASNSFRFLELSAELRNNIYDKAIQQEPLVVSRNTAHRKLTTASALPRVNQQIRSEFLNLAIETTPVIKTEVRNWDFGHIVSFLNRIDDDELERFVSERRIVLDFWFSGENFDPAGLMRWLDRFDDERRGAGVVFEYACNRSDYVARNWEIAGFRACTVGGPNGREQFNKIEEVFCAMTLE